MTWMTCPVICAVCSHRWQAVIEGNWDNDPPLECPACGSDAGIRADGEENEEQQGAA